LKQKDLCGIPWRVAFALQADGWYLRNDIIWHKPSAIPESVGDRCTKAHEYIFLLTKKAQYWYDQDAIREPCKEESIKRDQTGYKAAFVGRHTIPGDNRPHSDSHNSFNHPFGRNKRTVWTVSAESFKGAHFATFATKLIEPCIRAGCPSRVCMECGESWVRAKASNIFTPTCQCCPLPTNKESTIPGVVLDPFFGAGTVGVVAKQLKRNWLGIELNANYIEMAWERLDQTQPALFSE
jgi:DNA modification methylase